MITQKQIAEMLGISRTTVARALKKDASIKEETRKKVLEMVEQTNYEKNYLGSSLAGKQKIVHAFIVKSKNEFYTNEIKRAMINSRKKYAKYRMEIRVHIHDINQPEEQTNAIQKFLEGKTKMDGILVVPLEKEKVYTLLEPYLNTFPIFSLTMRLHEKIPHIGTDYKEQGRMVAGILTHCLREKDTLVILDNGDDKLSTKDYLEGFLERIRRNKKIQILGPYSCDGVKDSIELLNKLEEKRKIIGFFSNRYAQEIISLLGEKSLLDKKIVLNGMGTRIRKLLKEEKIIATVMEEVYEQAYLAGKLMFESLYQNKKKEVCWRKINSKIIYLENLEEN